MNQILKQQIRTALISIIAYYELFAVLLIFLPPSSFPLIGLEPTSAAWPLRLSALMIGAMGLGLFFPLYAPYRHWAVTALIAFGQIALPTGTLLLMWFGDLPVRVGLPMALVDLVFLVPAVLALVWTSTSTRKNRQTPSLKLPRINRHCLRLSRTEPSGQSPSSPLRGPF